MRKNCERPNSGQLVLARRFGCLSACFKVELLKTGFGVGECICLSVIIGSAHFLGIDNALLSPM